MCILLSFTSNRTETDRASVRDEPIVFGNGMWVYVGTIMLLDLACGGLATRSIRATDHDHILQCAHLSPSAGQPPNQPTILGSFPATFAPPSLPHSVSPSWPWQAVSGIRHAQRHKSPPAHHLVTIDWHQRPLRISPLIVLGSVTRAVTRMLALFLCLLSGAYAVAVPPTSSSLTRLDLPQDVSSTLDNASSLKGASASASLSSATSLSSTLAPSGSASSASLSATSSVSVPSDTNTSIASSTTASASSPSQTSDSGTLIDIATIRQRQLTTITEGIDATASSITAW